MLVPAVAPYLPPPGRAAQYDWDDNTLKLVINMASISYMVGVPAVSFLASRYGLRRMMVGTAVLLLATVALRLITAKGQFLFGLATASMLCNGFAGSWLSFGGALVSQRWFPEHERATATAVMTVSCYLGIAVGFILTPLAVPTGSGQTPLSHLLLGEAAFILVVAVAIFVHFPEQPPVPPSMSAMENITPESKEGLLATNMPTAEPEIGGASDANAWKMLLFSALSCCRWSPEEPDYDAGLSARPLGSVLRRVWALGAAYGLSVGLYCGWIGILDIVIAPFGLSQQDAGWIGCWMTMSGCIGAVAIGRANDWFRGQMKATIIVCLTLSMCGGLYLWLIEAHLVPGTKTALYVSCIWIGFWLNCTVPLYFELMMETVHRRIRSVPGTAATGLLTLLKGFIQVVYTGVPGLAGITSQLLTLVFVMTVGLLTCFRADYPRGALDRVHLNRGGPRVDPMQDFVGCIDAIGCI